MHTQGKWKVAERFSGGKLDMYWIICPEHPPLIAKVLLDGNLSRTRSDKEHLANARLIAAAPDLLEALEALLWKHDNNNGALCGMALQDARAAIEKAKGGA
jgi:hypothetical protein